MSWEKTLFITGLLMLLTALVVACGPKAPPPRGANYKSYQLTSLSNRKRHWTGCTL